jgi:hypothetical protein
MKNLLGTIVALVLLAAGMGFFCYRLNFNPALHAAVANGDAMVWLRTDFHLDDRQFAEMKKLHDAYAPSCEEHCRMIQEATKAHDALKASDPVAAAAAERRLQGLRTACEIALAAHVRQVAAVMAPEEGRRYLAMVLPKIAEFDHTAAPDLQLNRPH